MGASKDRSAGTSGVQRAQTAQTDQTAVLLDLPGAAENPVFDSRPHRVRGISPGPFLLLLAAVFLGCALIPDLFELLDDSIGVRRLVVAALGFLFVYAAWLTREQGRLRERVLDLMEEVLKIFYGPHFRREREAIDILVKAMDSENASVREASRQHLVRLTAEDRGNDAAAWADWWTDHRSTFRSPGLRVRNS